VTAGRGADDHHARSARSSRTRPGLNGQPPLPTAGWAHLYRVDAPWAGTIDLIVRVDLVAASSDVTTRRIARLLGERGEGRATIDLGTIEGAGGTFVDARGRLNRFRGWAHADVDTGPASWSVDATLTVGGRGFGRVVMLLARRRLRRHVEGRLQRFWQTSDTRITRAESALRELELTVQREGGESAFIHRALWDTGFDPRPPGAPD